MFSKKRLLLASSVAGLILVAIFAGLVVRFRTELREEIRQKIIERDAAVLHPVALQLLAEREVAQPDHTPNHEQLLAAVLKSAQQEGILAVTVFDAEGNTLGALPASLLFAELGIDDYARLLNLKPISSYHPQFALDRYFGGFAAGQEHVPVLEVLLPLHGRERNRLLGFAQYYLDARPLARELALIDQRVDRQTAATLLIGASLIAIVVGATYLGLRRAERVILEHNDRLARANFELVLSTKASALGQITSHLIHGLRGPVASLQAVMGGAADAEHTGPDWSSAAEYTTRMQTMIEETVALLGDATAQVRYDLSGKELAATIRSRNSADAIKRGVILEVAEGFSECIDSHRGSLLCLIASNLVQNSLAATKVGRRVFVELGCRDGIITMTVADEGEGIPQAIQTHLFEPGRSGKIGGTGLGLAISRLLARQISAELDLTQTGPTGTTFRLLLAKS